MADQTPTAIAALAALLHRLDELPGLGVSGTVKEQLTTLADKLGAGTISEADFVELSRSALAGAYMNSYLEGLGISNPGQAITNTEISHVNALIEQQVPYLEDFAAAVTDGTTVMPIEQRAAQYESGLHAPYQLGVMAGLVGTGIVAGLRWIAQDDEGTCDPCAAAEKNGPYTFETLPGVPGSDVCDWPPNCRCEIRGS
jgi:hypothetical protein